MRQIFNSPYRITQEFNQRPEYYSSFGLKGHEGIDLVPTGSDWTVKALADGVVVKDDDIAGTPKGDAYGINVTIWHQKLNRATMYCHLTENYVSLNQNVKAGENIGKMGATGNTSGAHVHLNLFVTDSNGIRQNKDNGYLGGIDPKPFLEEDSEPMAILPQGELDNNRKKSVQFDQILIEAHKRSITPDDKSENWIDEGKLVKRLFSHVDHLEEEKSNLQNENVRKQKNIIELNGTIEELRNENSDLKQQLANVPIMPPQGREKALKDIIYLKWTFYPGKNYWVKRLHSLKKIYES